MEELNIIQTHKLVIKLYKHCIDTYRHSIRVGDLLYQFACYMNLDDTEYINTLGILHDIGKLKIPVSLLNKTTKLTQMELKKIKLHTEYGQQILDNIKGFPQEYFMIVKYHHENFDSSGYYGLEGEDIPLLSRMIRIIDSYDTMFYGRAYQEKKSESQVLYEICDLGGTHYDPALTEEFKNFIEMRTSILRFGT